MNVSSFLDWISAHGDWPIYKRMMQLVALYKRTDAKESDHDFPLEHHDLLFGPTNAALSARDGSRLSPHSRFPIDGFDHCAGAPSARRVESRICAANVIRLAISKE